ncbi:MAG: hypothetical protein WD118_05925 [Phycisphaeraceae bacterium]
MGNSGNQYRDQIPTVEPPGGSAAKPRHEPHTDGSLSSCRWLHLSDSNGSATVEQTGLVLLLSATIALVIGFGLLTGERGPGREIGTRIADRIACGPRAPDACHHHPAVEAYGWPVARALRQLAPWPAARPGPDGTPLMPVDFRYCRSRSCAVPEAGERGLRLTTSNRRITYFTEVRNRGQLGGRLELVWWLYRPGLGWEGLRRNIGPEEIEAASGTRVLLSDTPMLVPLETLDGRNHVRFAANEQPPWQWTVGSVHTGRMR